ncbi:MAG: isocitrate lyase/phosphoenolpyruvate mutase family protein [Parvularculaceae bacterium]
MPPASTAKTDAFRRLHVKGSPFVVPNPWDAGSARILEGLGFKALATSSSAAALTLGRTDYAITREEALGHCRLVAGAVDIPVSADLESGFGPKPEDCALTIREAAKTGLAGGSIEDSTGDSDAPIHERTLAVERVRAAVEAARAAPGGFVLTARAEAFLHGKGDLDEVIARLNDFAEAGADVLFAPGLPNLDAIRAVTSSLSKPVNVLAPGRHGASLKDLAAAGVARVSVGGGLAYGAYGALVAMGEAIARDGDFKSLGANAEGAKRIRGFLKQG